MADSPKIWTRAKNLRVCLVYWVHDCSNLRIIGCSKRIWISFMNTIMQPAVVEFQCFNEIKFCLVRFY